jgi:hypothetical protein
MIYSIEMYESVDVVPAYTNDNDVAFVVNGVNSSPLVDDIVVLMAAVQILENMPGTGDWAPLLKQFIKSIEVDDQPDDVDRLSEVDDDEPVDGQ